MNLTNTTDEIKLKKASKVAGFTFTHAIPIVVIADYGINFAKLSLAKPLIPPNQWLKTTAISLSAYS